MTIKDLDLGTRAAIEAVPLKLIDAVTRNDPDLYASCFLEDAFWDASQLTDALGMETGFPYRGRKAIREAMSGFEEALALAIQTHFSTHIDDYTGDTACVRYYIGEVGRSPGGAYEIGIGMYSDVYRLCEDGEWRVQEHVLTPVMATTDNLRNILIENHTIKLSSTRYR